MSQFNDSFMSANFNLNPRGRYDVINLRMTMVLQEIFEILLPVNWKCLLLNERRVEDKEYESY